MARAVAINPNRKMGATGIDHLPGNRHYFNEHVQIRRALCDCRLAIFMVEWKLISIYKPKNNLKKVT